MHIPELIAALGRTFVSVDFLHQIRTAIGTTRSLSVDRNTFSTGARVARRAGLRDLLFLATRRGFNATFVDHVCARRYHYKADDWMSEQSKNTRLRAKASGALWSLWHPPQARETDRLVVTPLVQTKEQPARGHTGTQGDSTRFAGSGGVN